MESNNFIEIYDGVLDSERCAALIKHFENDPRRQPGRIGHGVDPTKKDSIDLTLNDYPEWNDELQAIQLALFTPLCDYMMRYPHLLIGALSPQVEDPQLGQVVSLNHDNFERLGRAMIPQLVNSIYRSGRINLQKYAAGHGNFRHWHSEVYPQADSVEPLHRVLLYQFYLNDVSRGGCTNFYYQQRQIEPRRGRLVIAPAGFTHTHRGETPESNDKYVLTSWIMFKTAEALYNPSAAA